MSCWAVLRGFGPLLYILLGSRYIQAPKVSVSWGLFVDPAELQGYASAGTPFGACPSSSALSKAVGLKAMGIPDSPK